MKTNYKSILHFFAIVFFLIMSIGCKHEVHSADRDHDTTPVITFVDENGNNLGTQTVYVGTVTFNYTKTGYKTRFFDEDGSEVYSGQFSTNASCNITVSIEPISYTVKFKTSSSVSGTFNGTLPDPMVCLYDTEYNLPENSLSYTSYGTVYSPCGWTKNMYSCSSKGEFSSGGKIKNLTSTDGAEIILYACYNYNSYSSIALRFYKNDYDYSTIYVENGDKINESVIPAPNNKTGYEFDGYYLSTDTTKTVIDFKTYRVTGEASFKPKYSLATYKATFVNDHGTAPSPVTWTYTTTSTTVANLTSGDYALASITGYDFDGWYKKGTTTKKISINSCYDYEDMILVAKWNPWYGEIRYNKNVASGVSSGGDMGWKTIYYDSPEKLKENTFYAIGYRFKGWNTKADGTGVSYADGATFTWKGNENRQIINLYAQWEKLQTSINVSVVSPSTNSDIILKYVSTAKRFEAQFPGVSSFSWYIDGVIVPVEKGPTLSIYTLSEGQHTVMVTSDMAGKTYGQTLVVNVSIEE